VCLGLGARLSARAGATYRTDDRTTGEVRSFPTQDWIRITARPPGWDHDATIQVAVQAKGDKTSVRFHQERLAGAQERERQRDHCKAVAACVVQPCSA
jgi:hypothetical protein